MCGIQGGPIPQQSCLRTLWTLQGCNIDSLTIDNTWMSYSVSVAENKIREIHQNSLVNKFDSNGVLYRSICFGITSINTKNILYKAVVKFNHPGSDDVFHPSLITDGLREGKMDLVRGCFMSVSVNPLIIIELSSPEILRKIVIYTKLFSGNLLPSITQSKSNERDYINLINL